MVFYVQVSRKQLSAKFNNSVYELVKSCAADLIPVLCGSLMHRIFYTGLALDAVDSENPWMIIEGLNYLNFCYLPMQEEKFVIFFSRDSCTYCRKMG